MAGNKLPIFFRFRILWHILFWITVYLMYSITYGGYLDNYYEEFIINLTLLPARILGTYTLIYGLLPLILEKNKFVIFTVMAVVHALLYGFLIWITIYYLNLFPDSKDYSQYPLFYLPKILNKIISNYGIPGLAATVVLLKKWYTDEQQRKKLTQEKLAAELNFLKSQIHPHFLFNTLNNLYALTLIKSEKTPDIVLKLSGLLDYMLYKSDDEFVSLQKELDILESYVELEKLRYNNRLDLKFNVEGDVTNKQIAPLIMLHFIENSFKHGASNDRTSPQISIDLKIKDEYLHLRVVNSTGSNLETEKPVKEGIGLKNVRRRLELIYNGNYNLECQQKNNRFEVDFKLFWKSGNKN